MLSPSMSTSQLKCDRCDNLRLGILKQIGAFKILASINPKLSWTILVDNLEELLRVGSEKITVPENGHLELEWPCIDLDENDGKAGGNENTDATIPMETNHGCGDSNMDIGSKRPSTAAVAVISKRRKKKKKNKLMELELEDKSSSETAPTSENPLSGERLQETNKFIRTYKRGPRRSFECLLCHKSLTLKRNTQLHIRRVHMGDRLPCTECPLKFYDYKNLGEHRVKCHGAAKQSCSSSILSSAISEGHEISEAVSKTNDHQEPKKDDERKKKKKRKKNSPSSRNGPTSHYLNSITVRNPFKNFDLKQALNVQVLMERLPDGRPNLCSSSSSSQKKSSQHATTPTTTTRTTTNATTTTTTTPINSHSNFAALEMGKNSDVANKSQDHDSGSIVVKIDPYDMAGVQIKVDTDEMMDQSEELMTLYMPERYMDYGTGEFPGISDNIFHGPPYPSMPPFDNNTGEEAPVQNIMDGPDQPTFANGSRATKEQVDSHIRKLVTAAEDDAGPTFECLLCSKTFHKRINANVHVRKIHFQERIQCDRCGLKFYDGRALRKHRPQCSEEFVGE